MSILRKDCGPDGVCAFWLNDAGQVRGWWDGDEGSTPEEEAASGNDGGWECEEVNAVAICGTSLVTLRNELMEAGDAKA